MAPSIVPTNDDSLSLRIAAAAAAATSSNGHFLKHISCYDQHNLNNLHNNINNNRSGNNHSNNNNNLNELLNASANKFSDCIVNSNVIQQQQQQNHHSVISKCENNVVFSENNRNMLTAAAAVEVTAPSTIGSSVECCSHGRKISDVSSPQSQQSIITPSPGTTCNSCNRKSKGKLCKMCRSNDNNKSTVAGESGELGKDRSKSSKKNNWGIRFKRSNKQSTSSAAAKTTSEQTANKTYTCLCTTQSQSCDATGDATSLPLISAPTTCATSNNSIVEDTTSHILDTNQTQNLLSSSNNPTQLRNAALQFFPAHQGALMSSAAVGNTVAPIPTTTASDSGGNNNNNHNINAQSASVLQQQQHQQQQQNHLNNQLLQRAATAAFYGNGGGNVIFLSVNPSTPQARISDIARLHPDEYPIEDCDERARIQRAYEIAEGVEPPPGYRSNLQPQPNVQQPNPNTPQAPATAAAWQMLQLQCNESLQNILNNRNSFQHFMLQNIMPPDELPRIHSQVDFIHCLVPDLKKITSCGFYWGKMDRYEAERLLEGKPEGTFLLRDSAQEEFLFSVSFRKYGRSLHARIEQFNHKFSFDSHDPCVYTASTVTGLLEHYKDPTCVMFFEPMLTIPLNRNFVFSLQQLCRATIVSSTTYDGIDEFALPQTLKSYLKEYHYKQRVRVRRLDEITPMLIPSLEGF